MKISLAISSLWKKENDKERLVLDAIIGEYFRSKCAERVVEKFSTFDFLQQK